MTPAELHDEYQHLRSAIGIVGRVAGLARPPPRLTLSEWADTYFRLSAESSAQSGQWTCLPYQRAIMDAITDPEVRQISLMKSSRIGYTLMVSAAIGYHIHQAPCSILLVQPTVEDAKGYSKETIAPMLRDVPVLAAIAYEDERPDRSSADTILGKRFPGGVLTMIGATSGAGFRRVSRKVVIFDEVDGYPVSAGSDGDPVTLGTRRAEYYHDRKIIAGSTPLVSGVSRIEALYNEGDQRRYYVPCPQCGHMDVLVFTERASGGHWLKFDTDHPEGAHFVCGKNGCVIEHKNKRDMVARGEWRAAKPFAGHASFHLWAAYSYSPNATWAQIALDFIKARAGGRETLRSFVNTTLGETFRETGEAPDWERLYSRREDYRIGTVPGAVRIITCGVDVQRDRWIYEVVGWAEDRQSWTIDAGVLPGTPADESAWAVLDALLDRTYPRADGSEDRISMLAVDSGDQTQAVYGWVRRHSRSRVMACKGTTQRTLIASPTPVDVRSSGRRIARGTVVWPIGSGVAKGELYGWLRLPLPAEGRPCPPGWCHFPDGLGQDFFRQLTAEQLVTVVRRTGHSVTEWQVQPGRENHYLDARVLARAAAAVLGLDRMARSAAPPAAKAPAADPPAADPPAPAVELAPAVVAPPPPVAPPTKAPRRGWLGGGRRGKWLER
jgi:phage terminase large subunit GpA-like protein